MKLNVKVVKIKMLEKNFNIRKLSNLAEVTYSHMAGVLTAHKNVSVRMLSQLAKALECSMDELLKKEE